MDRVASHWSYKFDQGGSSIYMYYLGHDSYEAASLSLGGLLGGKQGGKKDKEKLGEIGCLSIIIILNSLAPGFTHR